MNKIVLAFPLLFLAVTSQAISQEAALANKQKGRLVIRDERPDTSRGWVVVAKSTYWPLCYEALEQLEQLKLVTAESDRTETAVQIEKCTAWLGMAASAAMLTEKAKVRLVIQILDGIAIQLNETDRPIDAPMLETLKTLSTMGKLSVARSHVIRSGSEQQDVIPNPKASELVAKSKVVKELELEAELARQELHIDQYRYDTAQSIRHLQVARTYLESAEEDGNLEPFVKRFDTIEPLNGKEAIFQLTSRNSDAVSLARVMLEAIEARQEKLAATLPELDEE